MFFLQAKTLIVEEGHGDKMVAKFAADGIIEEQPGFIDLQVMKQKPRKGQEEILVLIRWDSEESWKAWEKSDAHLAGHRANRGKPKPSFIIDSNQKVYNHLAGKSSRKPVKHES
ncbi:antibiotic biosynthesis monooxygenase family protein [Shouchella clausii]|uniref:antibiotic biosynthesis monooxygenase family protein n=1 Tax=Shouchella clausii TaxID=79880 RepID=UPI000BA71624|nr:antibiotic biosynthesis monooxygenase [Shouchella clausii]PAD18228.1 antibiotic biosynthesis monooxygenase [Shouchella clausii]